MSFRTLSPQSSPAVKTILPSPSFPVVYSTLAHHALRELVIQSYDLPRDCRCKFWHRGLSDVYLFETGDRDYVFRVSHHHWRTRAEIEFELEFLQFLAGRGFPVSAPINHSGGDRYLVITAPEGDRYGALFSFAPGAIALGDLNKEQSATLGQTVARLHHLSREFSSGVQRPDLDLAYMLDQSLAVITPFLAGQTQALDYLESLQAQIHGQLAHLPQTDPYWVVCWGDAHSGNAHFLDNHQVTLFDFDQCGYGWRVFELAKFLQVSLSAGMRREVRQGFIDAYQRQEPLTPEEQAVLKPLTQTAQIWSWAISITNAQISDYSLLDDFYFRQRLEGLKNLAAYDWQLFDH